MKPHVSPLRRALSVLLTAGAAAALVAACASERPGATQDGNPIDVPVADRCATPHEGCDCVEPGMVVDCGEVRNTSSDGFVQCAMGHRQCLGGAWGACRGETDVEVKTFMAGGGLGIALLGGSAKCGAPGGGPADPCDPYCNAFVDDPVGLVIDGGLTVIDGGLTIPPSSPDAGSDGGAPGGFTSTPGGTSSCGTANNLVASSCTPGTPAALTQCQQDFHCDAITSKCLWNGAAGYKDPAVVGGIDLTVGAPCGDNGNDPGTVPVCNRGDTPVPGGSVINFWITGGSTPPDSCTSLGAPTTSRALGGDLAPGQCTTFSIGNSTGAKIITINAGPTGSQTVNEAPGRCANNSAFYQDDGTPGCGACTACNTTITGKVYDPTGAGTPSTTINNLPLPGVDVFQPASTLKVFPDTKTCDSCDSLRSPFQTLAVTDSSGSFTLTNVSPGTNVPIVVQSGRWRRQVNVNVNACQNNTFPAGTFRMPRNKAEGTLPKIAVVTGQLESLACLTRKIGIDPAEIGPATGSTDTKRVQIFRYNGMNTSPAAPASSTLWSSAVLDRYTAVIMDCPSETNNPTPTNANRAAVRSYVDSGGRVFADHWAGDYLLNGGEFTPVATWNETLGTPGYPSLAGRGRIDTATPPEALLRNWLADPGVLGSTDYGPGWIRVDEARANARALVPGVYPWIKGRMSNDWGPGAPPGNPSNASNYALSFSFETPFPGGTCGGGGTGRVVYNGMHVNPARGTTGTFPGSCNFSLPLSPEEKALEFQLFQLTACAIGGGTAPAPPPPPPPLQSITFERTYQAICGVGERVKWAPFYWEALIPPSTSIEFRAATADTLAALPAAPPAGAPTTAAVGTANATVLAPTWDCSGCPATPVTVDAQLKADTGTPSKEWLRIYMKLNPTAIIPPVLYSWRQLYDCVPAE
ncbi:MAG: Tryptophan synthase alpha chain [Labilithrix sp.]|nr:Tryptophan synthase alpha chain [Labilithrix sp.]